MADEKYVSKWAFPKKKPAEDEYVSRWAVPSTSGAQVSYQDGTGAPVVEDLVTPKGDYVSRWMPASAQESIIEQVNVQQQAEQSAAFMADIQAVQESDFERVQDLRRVATSLPLFLETDDEDLQNLAQGLMDRLKDQEEFRNILKVEFGDDWFDENYKEPDTPWWQAIPGAGTALSALDTAAKPFEGIATGLGLVLLDNEDRSADAARAIGKGLTFGVFGDPADLNSYDLTAEEQELLGGDDGIVVPYDWNVAQLFSEREGGDAVSLEDYVRDVPGTETGINLFGRQFDVAGVGDIVTQAAVDPLSYVGIGLGTKATGALRTLENSGQRGARIAAQIRRGGVRSLDDVSRASIPQILGEAATRTVEAAAREGATDPTFARRFLTGARTIDDKWAAKLTRNQIKALERRGRGGVFFAGMPVPGTRSASSRIYRALTESGWTTKPIFGFVNEAGDVIKYMGDDVLDSIPADELPRWLPDDAPGIGTPAWESNLAVRSVQRRVAAGAIPDGQVGKILDDIVETARAVSDDFADGLREMADEVIQYSTKPGRTLAASRRARAWVSPRARIAAVRGNRVAQDVGGVVGPARGAAHGARTEASRRLTTLSRKVEKALGPDDFNTFNELLVRGLTSGDTSLLDEARRIVTTLDPKNGQRLFDAAADQFRTGVVQPLTEAGLIASNAEGTIIPDASFAGSSDEVVVTPGVNPSRFDGGVAGQQTLPGMESGVPVPAARTSGRLEEVIETPGRPAREIPGGTASQDTLPGMPAAGGVAVPDARLFDLGSVPKTSTGVDDVLRLFPDAVDTPGVQAVIDDVVYLTERASENINDAGLNKIEDGVGAYHQTGEVAKLDEALDVAVTDGSGFAMALTEKLDQLWDMASSTSTTESRAAFRRANQRGLNGGTAFADTLPGLPSAGERSIPGATIDAVPPSTTVIPGREGLDLPAGVASEETLPGMPRPGDVELPPAEFAGIPQTEELILGLPASTVKGGVVSDVPTFEGMAKPTPPGVPERFLTDKARRALGDMVPDHMTPEQYVEGLVQATMNDSLSPRGSAELLSVFDWNEMASAALAKEGLKLDQVFETKLQGIIAAQTYKATQAALEYNITHGLMSVMDEAGNPLVTVATDPRGGRLAKGIEESRRIPQGHEELLRVGDQVYYAPTDIHREVKDVLGMLSSQAERTKLSRVLNEANNLWAGFATAAPINPGALFFNTRNAIGNMLNAFLGGVKDPRRYVEAALVQKHYRSALRQVKRGSSIDDAIRSVTDSRSRHILQQALDEDILSTSFFTAGLDEAGNRFTKAVERGTLMPAGRAFASEIENNARLALFIDAMDKGMDARSAAIHTKKFLFDYGDLTGPEYNNIRAISRFYTFMRKNTALQVDALIHTPGRVANANRIAELWVNTVFGSEQDMSGAGGMPEYLAVQGAKLRAGNFISLDTPFFAAGETVQAGIAAASLVPGGTWTLENMGIATPEREDAWRDVLQLMSGSTVEMASMLFEGATGTDSFTGGPLRNDSLSRFLQWTDILIPAASRAVTMGEQAGLWELGQVKDDQQTEFGLRLMAWASGASATMVNEEFDARQLDYLSYELYSAMEEYREATGFDLTIEDLREAGKLESANRFLAAVLYAEPEPGETVDEARVRRVLDLVPKEVAEQFGFEKEAVDSGQSLEDLVIRADEVKAGLEYLTGTELSDQELALVITMLPGSPSDAQLERLGVRGTPQNRFTALRETPLEKAKREAEADAESYAFMEAVSGAYGLDMSTVQELRPALDESEALLFEAQEAGLSQEEIRQYVLDEMLGRSDTVWIFGENSVDPYKYERYTAEDAAKDRETARKRELEIRLVNDLWSLGLTDQDMQLYTYWGIFNIDQQEILGIPRQPSVPQREDARSRLEVVQDAQSRFAAVAS